MIRTLSFSLQAQRFAAVGLLFVTLATSTGRAGNQVLIATGDAAPQLPGGVVASVGEIVLNPHGQVAMAGLLVEGSGGVTSSSSSTIWRWRDGATAMLARAGVGGVPGAAGTDFNGFSRTLIVDDGTVFVEADLVPGIGDVTSESRLGVWKFADEGDVVARSATTSAPGVPGAVFTTGVFRLRATANGRLPLTPQLALGGGVTSLNDRGVWNFGLGGEALLIREGITAVPGAGSAKFFAFNAPAMNVGGDYAFRASLQTGGSVNSTNSAGIWQYDAAGVGQLLGRTGSGNVPGIPAASFTAFRDPTINAAGQVAFHATAAGAGGIWRYDGGAGELVQRVGGVDPVGVPGGVVAALEDPLLGSDGAVLYSAELQPGVGGVTAADAEGIWLAPLGAPAKLVARTGSGGVGGITGASYSDFLRYTMNGTGQLAFAARLAHQAGVVDDTNDQGIWLADASGEQVLVARTGTTLGGVPVEVAIFSSGTGVEDGRPRVLNDYGQLAYLVGPNDPAAGNAAVLFTPDLKWRGPTFGDWDDVPNWTLGLKPALVHDVSIGGPNREFVTGPAAPTTVKSLSIGGTFAAAELRLQPGGDLTATNGLTVLSTGFLEGSGRVVGSVNNAGGSISPGNGLSGIGRIDIDGDYVQGAGAIMSIRLAGTDNSNPLAPQYDRVEVSGAADLGGALAVHLATFFTPQIGDSFGVLVAGGGFDGFDSYLLPTLPAGRQWQVNPGGSTLFLNVVASGGGADFNGSGAVDGTDLGIWKSNFGAAPSAAQAQGDATGDGRVDGADFLAWQRQFGPGGAIATVPEPAAASLLSLAAAVAVVGQAARRPR
ncbi:MAG: hypothetical protein KF688_13410 [Pirellulales bacterium]|nr:hypothetical protein [Pirellulales bacterium]